MKPETKETLDLLFETFSILAAAMFCVFVVMVFFTSPVFAEEVPPEPLSVSETHEYDGDERDYLIVVNRDNPYDFHGEYAEEIEDDLVWVADSIDGDPIGIESRAYYDFTRLQQKLAQDGMIVGLYDGYRTWGQQKNVYDYFGSLEGWADKNTVLLPYFSEHHTGLLLNVVIWYDVDGDGKPEWCTETAERQQQVPFFGRLHENLADFGFIDRYPAGKEKLTGVVCEPYEIRYVGSPEMAHRIMDDGFCLEEVVGEVPISQPWPEDMVAKVSEFALFSGEYFEEIADLVDGWIMKTSGL